MEQQKQAALTAMSGWLADEHELGRPPAKIECAGEFERYGLRYYLFKFKKSALSRRWLLGVCGGYEGESAEHCGHVFSEMEEYSPDTAVEKAVRMVEMMREYWMRRAAEEMEKRGISPEDDGGEQEPEGGNFVGFVLLSSNAWDPGKLKRDLKDGWNISVEDSENCGGNSFVWDVEDMLLAVSLMPGPVPEGEAEENAANNYLWPGAVDAAKAHKAHLLVAVLGHGRPATEAGQLFVKACSACLRQENALAVYTSGTVFEPKAYCEAADVMRNGGMPVYNWITIGLYRTENGMGGYTYNMTAFGKEEIEVLDSIAQPQELYEFLFGVASYVLEEDVTLRDGETIGFTENQKLPITRSKGKAVEGFSLKIQYS